MNLFSRAKYFIVIRMQSMKSHLWFLLNHESKYILLCCWWAFDFYVNFHNNNINNSLLNEQFTTLIWIFDIKFPFAINRAHFSLAFYILIKILGRRGKWDHSLRINKLTTGSLCYKCLYWHFHNLLRWKCSSWELRKCEFSNE